MRTDQLPNSFSSFTQSLTYFLKPRQTINLSNYLIYDDHYYLGTECESSSEMMPLRNPYNFLYFQRRTGRKSLKPDNTYFPTVFSIRSKVIYRSFGTGFPASINAPSYDARRIMVETQTVR